MTNDPGYGTAPHSLVVQHNVRQPDVVGGHVEVLDAAVIGGVPLELVVDPLLGCYSVMS